MQRRRVGVVSLRVVSVWVLARIEEKAYDVHVPMLRGECKRTMAALTLGGREQLTCIGEPPQPARRGEVIYSRSAFDKCLGSAPVSERESRHQRRSPLTGATRFDRRAEIQ